MTCRYDLLDFVMPILEESDCDEIMTDETRYLLSELRDGPMEQWFLQRRPERGYCWHQSGRLREPAAEYTASPQAVMAADSGLPVVDLARAQVRSAHGPVALTAAETRIMVCLARRPGAIVSREVLSEVINLDGTGSVWTDPKHHIRNLRVKLGDDLKNPRIIVARRGIGYLLHESMRGRLEGLEEFSGNNKYSSR